MNTKKLGFGCMRLPMKDECIDMALVEEMVDTFLRRGFTYFDTAWMYCGNKSEEALGAALVKRHPRDSFTLTTKLPFFMLKTPEDRDKVFFTQLERTGAGYFDYYLLHDVNDATISTFRKMDCFNWLRQKQAEGLAKHIGFSFHGGPELLDQLLTEHPDMEYVQLQINYLDWESESVQARKNYEVARKFGKKILVMEPVKGGTLANVPEEVEKLLKAADPQASCASWALRFAASLPGVELVLSGMSDMAQMLDNTAFMDDFRPLTEEEAQLCRQCADIINGRIAIPCTGCAYCVVDCPRNICIPQYFAIYNADYREAVRAGWNSQFNYFGNLTVKFGKPSDCIGCGKCEKMCPQHLPIREHLKEVTKRFE